MAQFEPAHKIVMGHEGGYANNHRDRGGETYKGIARKRWPNWKGWPIIDMIKTQGIKIEDLDKVLQAREDLQKMVLAFYKTNFWDALCLDAIGNQDIAVEMYDTGVNMGTGIAAEFLQTALNVSNNNGVDYSDLNVDRSIGPKTVSVLNIHKRPKDILKVLNCLQGARYIQIMKEDPSQEVFFRSWFSRVTLYWSQAA